MKFYSDEVTRVHAQDLTNELQVKQIEERLRYFIVNTNEGAKPKFPMYNLAGKFAKEWAACGLLDLHDLSQECYCALIKAYGRVKWDMIDKSDKPESRLWKFLKQSVMFDTRIAINTFKDGMRIPRNKIWEAKKEGSKDFLENSFFTVPMPNMWFWENDEELNLIDDSRMSSWQTEELYGALEAVMHIDLSHIERQVLEMAFGIDQPFDEKRSVKYMANYFNMSERGIKLAKARALTKLKTDVNQNFLIDFIES